MKKVLLLHKTSLIQSLLITLYNITRYIISVRLLFPQDIFNYVILCCLFTGGPQMN